jgi:hypothetical protein
MTGREQWGLRGPVRTCRLQHDRVETTAVEFRADGTLLRSFYHNPDGSVWTTNYEYDGGLLTTIRCESSRGFVDLQIYEYDPPGRLLRVIARTQAGVDRVAERYEYDAAGRKQKTVYIDEAFQHPETQYACGVEGTDSNYSATGAARVVTIYNERGQPVELLFHDQAGGLLSRVKFLYDGAGRPIEEAQTNAVAALPLDDSSITEAQRETLLSVRGAVMEPLRRAHRYDAQGRRVESRLLIGPLGGDTTRVTYNDRGDPLLQVHEHASREYGIDDNGRLSDAPASESVRRSEARFTYDYDGRGNWIQRTVEVRAGAQQGFILSSEEQRTIEYFE